jgi:putative transposase
MDATMTSELVERALDAALVTRRPPPGLLHHSDRGSQYASHDDQARLQAAQVQVSMSRTGNCHDNALMESFWATLKTELIEDQVYASHLAARCDILLYIEGFYNLRRRHSALSYLSPTEFERRHWISFSAPEAIGA